MEIDTKPPSLPTPTKRDLHGDDRRTWSEPFLAYAYSLVDQPAYDGMPCTVDEDGKLDWTIPSNRAPGSKNWDGNSRRRTWWMTKAEQIGVPITGRWISQTAKRIHPWGWKPCQTCGRWMRIAYAYPTPRTIKTLNSCLPDIEQLAATDLLDIYEVAEYLVDAIGKEKAAAILKEALPDMRSAPGRDLGTLQRDLEAVVGEEPRGRLSPGAMSNAPDRLDGFHTYNLCCRSKEDTGRSPENLKTYGVDRRAFEHWSEGDWEAANQLMNQVSVGVCPRCGTRRELTADHIGPISLGFRHSPYFNAVCGACNSAKNNRMALSDVQQLLRLEASGVEVASRHAAPLWNRAKNAVADDADALRLSKLLNVNQHEFLRLLLQAWSAGIPDVLLQFLSPEFAEERVVFLGLDPVSLEYEAIERHSRQATYVEVKAARLIRIAFDTLAEYAQKPKRNIPVLPGRLVKDDARKVGAAISKAIGDESDWRAPLLAALDPVQPDGARDAGLRELIGSGRYEPDHDYSYVGEAFASYMLRVAEVLAPRLADSRAVGIW